MINCPSCGAELKFDVGTQMMKCSHCSGSFDPYVYDEVESDAEKSSTYDARVWVCPGCGASIECTDEEDITAVCSYCGNNRIIFDKIRQARRPDGIIPFTVTKDDCKELYRKAARRAFLSPGRLKDAEQIDSFRGIYMPYWSFLGNFSSSFTIPILTRPYRKGDYIIADENILKGKVTADLHYASHDASEQFDDNISESLAPYDSMKEKKFTPGYLCGFYAETDNMMEKAYVEKIKYDLGTEIISKTKKEFNFTGTPDEAGFRLKHFGNKGVRKLYPVWFMSTRRKNKMTYAAVNGSTGKVVADFPISPWKFFLFAFMIAALVFTLLNGFNVMLMPRTALYVTMALSIIAWALNGMEYQYLTVRESTVHTEPPTRKTAGRKRYISKVPFVIGAIVLIPFFPMIGSAFVNYSLSLEKVFSLVFVSASIFFAIFTAKRIRKKNRVQVFCLVMTFVVIGVSLFVQITKPLNVFYYVASGFNSSVFVLQFALTFHYHNRISYRRPPQFNKKGGDDNA